MSARGIVNGCALELVALAGAALVVAAFCR